MKSYYWYLYKSDGDFGKRCGGRLTMLVVAIAALSLGDGEADVLILGSGDDRANGIFKVAGEGMYECSETGASLVREGDQWLIGVRHPSPSLLYTIADSSNTGSPPEGTWQSARAIAQPLPTLTILRPGVCISSREAIRALGEVVSWRLQDADELSAARRPNSAASAFASAHALASTRCDELLPSRVPLPHSLSLIASGVTQMKLGQVLRASSAAGAPLRAITALSTAVQRMQLAYRAADTSRRQLVASDGGPRSGQQQQAAALAEQQAAAIAEQLSMTLLMLGHAHLGFTPSSKVHASEAVRAFRLAAAADPNSLPALASTGRALVLYARQHLTGQPAASNRTIEAAVRTFRRQLELLEAQKVPVSARRSDVGQ